MTDLQKALAVSFSGTLLGTENPRLDYHLEIIRNTIGLSQSQFNQYIDNIEFLIGNMGIMAFNSFSELSYSEKLKVQSIFNYALTNSNVAHIPQVQSLSNAVLNIIGV